MSAWRYALLAVAAIGVGLGVAWFISSSIAYRASANRTTRGRDL